MPAGSPLADGSPIGVVTVPTWRPGLAQSMLPSSYRDQLEVLADAGWPLRAGGIAATAGLSTDRSKVLHGRFIPRTTAGAAGPPSSTGSTHREKGPDCQLTNKMWQFTQLPSRFAKGPASMRTELAHLRPASHLVQRDYRRTESAFRVH